MKTTFTKQFIKENKGCYKLDQLNRCSFMNKPGEEVSIFDIINSEIRTKDKSWFIVRKCDLTNDEKVKFAVGCAKIVLEIFKNKHPEDMRPREAIEAAENYLNLTPGEMRAAAAAAAAATAAAAAAAAAHYAAAAAYYAAAAGSDTAAGADTADAAATAATAAYYAATTAAADHNEKLISFFNEFIHER